MTPCFWNRRKACPFIKDGDRAALRDEAAVVAELLPTADARAEAAVAPEAADPNLPANPAPPPKIADDAPADHVKAAPPPAINKPPYLSP